MNRIFFTVLLVFSPGNLFSKHVPRLIERGYSFSGLCFECPFKPGHIYGFLTYCDNGVSVQRITKEVEINLAAVSLAVRVLTVPYINAYHVTVPCDELQDGMPVFRFQRSLRDSK